MRITFGGEEFAKKELEKFFETFDLLTEAERDPFIGFLQSPYFNDEPRIALLYQRILDSWRLGSGRINGRPLLQFVFDELPEKKAKSLLRKFLKQLPDLLLTYMDHEEIKTNTTLGDRVRVTQLKKRVDSDLFQGSAVRMEQTLSGRTPTLMQFQDYWWLYHQLYFYQYAQQYDARDTQRLLNASLFLEDFYQLTSLRYYCEVLNRERIVGKEGGFESLTQGAGKFIDETSSRPVIAFYSMLARVLQFPKDPKIYDRFKTYYRKYCGELAKPDQLVMIKSVFNVCIRNYEAGNANGPEELIFWAKEGVAEGVFLFENSLSDKEYLNIAIAAGLAGELAFMEEFVEGYKGKMEEKIREQAYQMARIYLDFFGRDLSAVLERLYGYFPPQRSFDHIYTLRTKVFYILTYLILCIENMEDPESEEDYDDAFESHMEAYRKYIGRASFLNEDRRAPYKKFYNVCLKVFSYVTGSPDRRTEANKAGLLEMVTDEKALLARDVLIGLIRELKTR